MENRLCRFRSVAPWHTLAGCVHTCRAKESSPPRVVVACMCVFGGWECWPQVHRARTSTGVRPRTCMGALQCMPGAVHAWCHQVPAGAVCCTAHGKPWEQRGAKTQVDYGMWHMACVLALLDHLRRAPNALKALQATHLGPSSCSAWLPCSVKGHMSRLGQAERRYGTQRKERLQGSSRTCRRMLPGVASNAITVLWTRAKTKFRSTPSWLCL